MFFKTSVAAANPHQNSDINSIIPRQQIDLKETLEALVKLARTTPRPTYQLNDRPPRHSRTFARVVILAFIVGAATVGWQHFGRFQSPGTANPALGPEIAVATAPIAGESVSEAAVSPAQTAQETIVPRSPAPPPIDAQQIETIARELAALRKTVEQLDTTTHDVAGLRQTVEQLAAGQEQLARDIAELQAAGQESSRKIASSAPRSASAPAHKPIPTPSSAKPTTETSGNLLTRVLEPFQLGR